MHTIYKPLVSSGLAFGAKRWLAALDRQCDRIASVLVTPTLNNDDMRTLFCFNLHDILFFSDQTIYVTETDVI